MSTDIETDIQIKGTEDPDTNPRRPSHLTFYNISKTYIGENTASSINGAGESEFPHVEN